VVSTPRAAIEARVLVTERMRPIKMGRRIVHQIGMPYHWGNRGLVTGDSTNELIGFGADPNASIQESKALMGDIDAGRRDRQKGIAKETVNAPEAELRDLPVARHRPTGRHHIHAPFSKQGEPNLNYGDRIFY
jgi:hypothetical protein